MWQWFKSFLYVPQLQVFMVQNVESGESIVFSVWNTTTYSDLKYRLFQDYQGEFYKLETEFDFEDLLAVVAEYPKTARVGNIRSMYARVM